ncbi:MAG: glycosyltransferase [Kiritimatiellae bacterium]|nr:glycosyltransferase [Kiritimatiellia bacterium]
MKISIITPSFNQGTYIERTIQSVLSQNGDFHIEYIVIDGGSTDNTIDILRKYETKLKWISEPDSGQSDAINKGFAMASGDILAWLNSDDIYQPNALQHIADEYTKNPFTWCFGNCIVINENDTEIRRVITQYKKQQSRRYSYRRLIRRDFISQPATFFTRDAYKETGPIDINLTYSMDYDYWLRLGRNSPPRHIDINLSAFRWYQQSKNGAQYTKAAWETYLTARKHAAKNMRYDLFLHYWHYHILRLLYRFI